MKYLPWREVAAAVAGGLLVWAWRKRAGQPSAGQPISFVVPPLPLVGTGEAVGILRGEDTAQNDRGEAEGVGLPPQVAEALQAMMMRVMATPTRPQPLKDIHVHVDLNQYLILIYVYSYFAAAWVQAEAPRFGTLLYPQVEQGPYVLVVNRVYHPGHVAGWLVSGYGQEGVESGFAPVDSSG